MININIYMSMKSTPSPALHRVWILSSFLSSAQILRKPLFMGILPRYSLSISHLARLSHIPTPHTQVRSPSSSSSSPPTSSHPPPAPPPPENLMDTDSSGLEEEEDEEPAEDLERILLDLCSSSDDELGAPPSALGGVGDDRALDDLDGGFLEILDLMDGELEGGVEEELGDGEVVDSDGILDDFGALESELMGVGDLLVGLEEVVRR